MNKIVEKINNVFNYIGFDGCKHIIICSIISFILNIFLPSLIAVLITVFIGLLKELIYDRFLGKGTANKKDFFMNIVGSIIGGL